VAAKAVDEEDVVACMVVLEVVGKGSHWQVMLL
jgi:hypothetical protein